MTAAPASNQLMMRRDKATGLEAIRARFYGHAYEMHSHDDEWLVGVTHHGIQDFFCRGHRNRSTQGRVILIEPTERHDGQATEPEGFGYSMLYLSADWLRQELGGDGAIGFRQTLADDRALAQAVAGAAGAVLEGEGPLAVEHHRDRVLEGLRRHLGQPAPPQGVAVPEGLAEKARALILACYDQPIDNALLVAETGAESRFQLNRAFRARYGSSPHACLVETRLARARVQLRQGEAPAEVAAACGFADQSHMTRWFRRAYGLPPGAYARGLSSGRV